MFLSGLHVSGGFRSEDPDVSIVEFNDRLGAVRDSRLPQKRSRTLHIARS